MHALHPQPRLLLATALTIACLAFALILPPGLSGIDLQIGGTSGAARTGSSPPARSIAVPTPTGARWTLTHELGWPLGILARPVSQVPATRAGPPEHSGAP